MSPSNEISNDRYRRQARFAPLGDEGQGRLRSGRVLICGCGALGSVIANTLARAGVGFLRIVDRDFVELSNLQRQVLFTEEHVHANLPKAVAADQQLRKINSDVEIEPIVTDVTASNVGQLVNSIDVIADGTDNFETRFLLNDVAHQQNIPWVFGGCVGAEGQTATIVPGKTACLRCVIPDVPAAGTTPTCDSAGVLGPIVNVIASCQAIEVMKLLVGKFDVVNSGLNVFDLWQNRMRQISLPAISSRESCPACGRADYEWLDGRRGNLATVLCGRNAVQLAATNDQADVDLEALELRLVGQGSVVRNPYLLRFSIEGFVITVFRDGRAVVSGTDEAATARSVYSKFIG